MSDGKIIIMGTGGCGSGFVWHMLKRCGLETTEHREWIRFGGIIHSKDPANFPAPKVIKHLGGMLCNLNKHLANYQWEVDHIFFAVTPTDLALDIIKTTFAGQGRKFDYDYELKRYYWKLGQGLAQLAESDYPFTIIRCPDTVLDVDYCWEKMKVVLPDTSYEEFAAIHAAWVRPDDRARLATYGKK